MYLCLIFLDLAYLCVCAEDGARIAFGEATASHPGQLGDECTRDDRPRADDQRAPHHEERPLSLLRLLDSNFPGNPQWP